MMLTPLSLPSMNPLPSPANPHGLIAAPSHASLEGVPIYLVNTGSATTPTLSYYPKMHINTDLKATIPPSSPSPKVDTSKHHHIFVGDLSPEIENKTLKEAFAPFGEVSDAKVIRDMTTQKSKGYGFVSFVNKEEAERAIEQMNGQWLGRRTIRTNWATRKPHQPAVPKPLTFEEVSSQSGPQNMTVYVGNTNATTTEQHLKDAFSGYGNIQEIRIFKQQGYCFVRFDSKEAAVQAIIHVSGADVNGSQVRCSWGREDGGKVGSSVQPSLSTLNLAASLPANYSQYWANYYNYYANQAAAAAAVNTPNVMTSSLYQQMLQNIQQQQQQQQQQQLQLPPQQSIAALQAQAGGAILQPQFQLAPQIAANAYYTATQ